MALKTPLSISGTGLRPFGYKVQFGRTVAGGNITWTERLVDLHSVSLGYGASEQVCSFSTWDPTSIDPTSPIGYSELLVTPVDGDLIRITLYDGASSRLVFKGTVRGTHQFNQPSGITWSAEAISEISRLNEVHITANYNLLNDPIAPQARFDANGLLDTDVYTVKQIIASVMGFKDAWGTQELFSFGDIVWNGLDTEARCGGFKPSNISFDNTSKGQAIQQVLAAAGNFTYTYNPTTGQIHIVELNSECTACGPQWPLQFPSTDTQDIDADTAYASDGDTVKSDRTEWSTKQAANVCRVMAGPIEFYSGDYVIPERVTDPAGLNITAVDNDTVNDQLARSRNPDGVYYRFVTPSKIGASDARAKLKYVVGMPLFPDWNIFEDWLPAVYEIGNVALPPVFLNSSGTQTTGPTPAFLRDKAEFQPYTIGHDCAKKASHLGHADNLRAYQAWHTRGPCPACNGSGWVRQIYSANPMTGNDLNEPDITLVQQGPVGLKRWVIQITNWIMKPSEFGTLADVPRNDDNSPKLVPFEPNTELSYPVPWRNTCPFCRGVGLHPVYRIRNIQGELFKARSTATAGVNGIASDPDVTQAGPETWEAANNRLAIHAGPLLQVEVPISVGKYVLPDFSCKNLHWDSPVGSNLSELPDGSADKTTGVARPNTKRHKFPHPLRFMEAHKQLAGGTGVEVQVGDTRGRDKLVPDDWGCYVPFTTVQMGSPVESVVIDQKMGRVIFPEPVFIPCHYEWAQIQTIGRDNTARVGSDGLLMTHTPGRGYDATDASGRPSGYWRPARVWMTFKYAREDFYHDGVSTPEGTPIATTTFTANPFLPPGSPPPPRGQAIPGSKNYEARGGIVDGKYYLEVREISATPYTRIIQDVITDPFAKVEVFETDFWKMLVPPRPDMTRDELVATKKMGAYRFWQARCLTWERTTPGMAKVIDDGYADADYFASISRPQVRSWFLRDDRSRMLGMGVRHLEHTNKVQVSGSLELRGQTNDTSGGLGYVNYPNKGKAAVRKVTYNFSDGFATELELHREETRIGELPPEEKDRQHKVEKDIAVLMNWRNKPGNGGNAPNGRLIGNTWVQEVDPSSNPISGGG